LQSHLSSNMAASGRCRGPVLAAPPTRGSDGSHDGFCSRLMKWNRNSSYRSTAPHRAAKVGRSKRRRSGGRFPPMEPPAQRLLRLTRSTTCQEASHANVFIEVGPVDPLAATDETPVGTLRRSPVRQTRKPSEWHCDGPAISEIHHQIIIACAYALGHCRCVFMLRSTHAMTSTTNLRFPSPTFRCVRSPSGRSRGCFPAVPAQAKTSLFPLLAPHAREEAHLDLPNKRTTGTALREERSATCPVYTGSHSVGAASSPRQQFYG
jgi:hypothetical protein